MPSASGPLRTRTTFFASESVPKTFAQISTAGTNSVLWTFITALLPCIHPSPGGRRALSPNRAPVGVPSLGFAQLAPELRTFASQSCRQSPQGDWRFARSVDRRKRLCHARSLADPAARAPSSPFGTHSGRGIAPLDGTFRVR